MEKLIGHRPLQLQMRWTTEEGLSVAQAFKADPGDMFITTYAKCGTTWAQQLCHQLRTGGDEAYNDVSEVFRAQACAASLLNANGVHVRSCRGSRLLHPSSKQLTFRKLLCHGVSRLTSD